MISSIVICLLLLTVGYKFQLNFNTSFPQQDLSSIFSILREAFPLFLNGFLITYVYNEVKIVLIAF